MPANEAILRSGEPDFIDFTPAGGNIPQGEVTLLGNTVGLTCGIPHRSLLNNTLGAIAIGGGVYEMRNLNNAANFAKVWWDNTNRGVTTTSTNNALFGFIAWGGGGGTNSIAFVRHFPFV